MLSQFIKTFEPYSWIGSLLGKIGTIGYTGYGISQLWTNDNEETYCVEKASMTAFYLLHMAAMSLATTVMFGSTLVSPAVATAIVGISSLLKGRAELANERNYAQLLK